MNNPGKVLETNKEVQGKDHSLTQQLTFGWSFLICISIIILIIKIIPNFGAGNLTDDSLMFGRYSLNFIKTGQICWNIGTEHSYGLTSLGLLLFYVPLTLVFSNLPGLIPLIVSCGFGFLFLVLSGILLLGEKNNSNTGNKVLFLILLIDFCLPGNSFAFHLTSGMDTTFSMCYLVFILLLWRKFNNESSLFLAIVISLASSFAFYVRPDLLIFTFILPVYLFLTKAFLKKRDAFVIVILTPLLLGGILLFNFLYFAKPLPFPFYAKTSEISALDAAAYSLGFNIHQFVAFFQSYWFLFLVVLLDLIFFKNWWIKSQLAHKFLTLSLLGFYIFYTFFTYQIIGEYERFLYPSLPILIYLSCNSLARLSILSERADTEKIKSIFLNKKAFFSLSILITLVLIFIGTYYLEIKLPNTINQGTFAEFDLVKSYKAGYLKAYWYKLDQISNFPDDLIIAAGDVGNPGLLNPGKVIIDYMGLNDSNYLSKSFSIDTLLLKDKPDVIYFPNNSVPTFFSKILPDQTFQNDYTYFPAEKLGTKLGIAFRKDSKYYNQLMGLIK